MSYFHLIVFIVAIFQSKRTVFTIQHRCLLHHWKKTSEEAFPTSRSAMIMKNQKGKGTMHCVQLTELSNDIQENWKNTKYQRKEFKPAKKNWRSTNSSIPTSSHFSKTFFLLKQLNAFVRTVESLHSHITIDSIWIMAKSKNNNGFQRWHKDFQLGTKITTTIIINIGVQT